MRRGGGGRRESCFPSLRKGVLFEDLFPSLWVKEETFWSPWSFVAAWALGSSFSCCSSPEHCGPHIGQECEVLTLGKPQLCGCGWDHAASSMLLAYSG